MLYRPGFLREVIFEEDLSGAFADPPRYNQRAGSHWPGWYWNGEPRIFGC